MGRYVVFIRDADEEGRAPLSEAEQNAVFESDYEFGRQLEARGGRLRGGAQLAKPGEVRVRRRDQLVSTGPYAETAEVLNGFFIVEIDDAATLLELAEIFTRKHDVVEVWPVVAHGDD